MKTKHALPILSISMYALAAITLLVSITMLISALSFNRNAEGTIAKMSETSNTTPRELGDMLKSAVGILGVTFAGMMLITSALLFTAGQMLANSNKLSQRVTDLEAQLKALKPPA